jgi:hypothetical protein
VLTAHVLTAHVLTAHVLTAFATGAPLNLPAGPGVGLGAARRAAAARAAGAAAAATAAGAIVTTDESEEDGGPDDGARTTARRVPECVLHVSLVPETPAVSSRSVRCDTSDSPRTPRRDRVAFDVPNASARSEVP